MKRGILTWFVFLLLVSFVSSQGLDSPDAGIGGEEVEKIENLTDTYIPIDPETGEFNDSLLNSTKTKAQKRIDNINSWLEENASWLSVVFGMTPEISWLFVWNLYVILLFLVILFLNGELFFSFFSEDKAKIIGLVIFISLLIIKFYLAIAKVIHNIADVIWNTILPWGTAIALIIAVFLIIIAVIALPLVGRLLFTVGKFFESRREAKKKRETDADREVIHIGADALTG